MTLRVAKLILIFILLVNVSDSDGLDADADNLQYCRQFTADMEIKNLIDSRRQSARKCACFELQIQLDYSFEKQENNCYQEWLYDELGSKQMCCYGKNGQLLVGAPEGGYLVMTSEKINTSQIHASCCQKGGKFNRELCDLFYSVIPSDNCSSYHIPHSVMSWGDPSIQTLDGNTYDFNGHGEYIFLNTSDVEVQVRLDYVNPPNVDATMFTEVVIFVNKSLPIVEINFKKDIKGIDVYQNGKFLCNASRTTLSGRPDPCKSPPDQTCMVLSGHGIVSVQGCGLKNVANNIEFREGDFMSIKIFPLKSLNGSVEGLAGKQDGGKLLCKDGNSVGINGTAQEIFNCSETWKLKNEAESHFNYNITAGNFNLYNKFSKPRFLEELVGNLTALFANYSQENISVYNDTCRNYWDGTSNKECLLTIARTGNYNLGVAIMKTVNETRRQYNILHNPAPKFTDSTPSIIIVSYKKNETWTIDLKLYVRHNVPLNFSVETQLPKEEYNLTDGVFIWKIGVGLRYINSTSIIFVATDEYGKTDNKEMKVRYCGCEDPSECDFNSTNRQSSEQIFKVPCVCKEYYTGTFCTKFEDPCNSTECFYQSLCNAHRSKPLGDLDWPCSECPKGYTGTIAFNKQHCTDINECTQTYAGLKKCSQPKNCINTEGSFVCFCDKGYTLDKDDNITCNDIDECQSSPCPGNKICTNTDGNYTCDCEPGFVFERSDCVKIKGYRFVGEIDFEINPITANSDNIGDQSKTNLTHILLQAFNGTADFITVQIYSLSINASTGTHQPSLLRAKIIVHWANTSSATIQSSLQSSLGRILVTPFNLQSLEIQSLQNLTIFTPNVFGLCDVPGETDCDLPTTDCVNKIDLKGFECRCKSGYMPPKRSNINTPYCIDIIECEWENITEICLNGKCSNDIGSWSCQCPNPRYPTSKDLSTNKTRKFRCVGNFIYTGRMELFWLNPNVNKTQVEQLFQDKISDLFRTSNTTVDKYPISDIFLNLEILDINMSPIIGIGSRINVTYSLHTGEQTTPNKLQNIQNIIFETIKTFKEGEDIITIQTYLIYEESEHNLCDDTEKTKCDKETTDCHVDEGLYTCRCKRGYTNTSDPYTCQDIDECDLTGLHKCTNRGTCRNLPGNWTCDCPTGFEPIYNDDKNVTCEDIDECRQNESYICKGGCCKNVIGGWNCTCPSGYNRDELKRGYIYTCTDIDECDDHSLSFCSNGGYCKNNPGNWTCDCQNGYEAHAYNNTFIECKDINECEIKEKFSCDGPDNSSSCLNTNGSWDCQCASGYRKRNYSLNNRTCEDIDECVAGECIGGTCENTDGGFLCLCQTGFTNTSSEGHPNCTDIDECTSGQGKCHGGGTCSNTPGNWTCSCQTGFTPTFYNEKNITCEDFDECLHNGTYICNGGHCSNTIGGWNCSCSAGYYSKEIIKDRVYTCTDVDECSGAAVCMNGGTCVNTPGNWTCECSEGFRANSINNILIDCKDINECLENETYICTGGTCVDFNGGWNCTCPAGYKLNELQIDRFYTCLDIDECRSGTYCSNGGTCINNPGNWTCTCKDGFEAKSVNSTYIDCKDVDECSQNDKACIDGDCKNTVGAWQCLCVAGKKENVINETTKACSGVYVYAVTLEFAAVTTEKDNIDENNPKLIKYFEEQILQAYHTSFPQSTVKVNILKIKRSERRKRATEMSKWNVDFVAEFDKQLEQNDVVTALTNHTETCRLNNCQVNSEFPFTMLNAKLEPDPAPVVCDHYRYCDEETTRCEYVNHATKCTCKIGYEPKDNTDTTCRVKPDVCKKEAVCEHDATCVQPDNSGSFKCICQKGWTGETCNIAQTSVNDSDQTNTMMIAVGGSLGGIVIILLVTIFVVCRWRGKKVKEAEKIALKNMDNNGSKHFDGSLYDDRYIGDSQHNSLERKSVNSFRVPRQNESPIQSGYRLSAANLYATPHKLHRQTIHGSMIDLTNGHADHLRDEPRRLSIQDPQRHIASNMGWSYTANTTRPVSLNGDILRKHPEADYNRPPSPQPDYHRNERLDAARDSGVGFGHNRNGSFSNDYRHSDPLRRIPFDGPNGETRF